MTPKNTTRTGSALKEASGWFAAGDSFRRAVTALSDGAFKLFAYICLEADRRTGRLLMTQTELAQALGKSTADHRCVRRRTPGSRRLLRRDRTGTNSHGPFLKFATPIDNPRPEPPD